MSLELTNIEQNAYSASNRLFGNNEKPIVVREDNARNRNNSPDGKPALYSSNLSGATKAELNIIQREVPNPDSKKASDAYEIVARNVPDYSEDKNLKTYPKENTKEIGEAKADNGEIKPVFSKAASDIAKEADEHNQKAEEKRANDERRVKEILNNRDRFETA